MVLGGVKTTVGAFVCFVYTVYPRQPSCLFVTATSRNSRYLVFVFVVRCMFECLLEDVELLFST